MTKNPQTSQLMAYLVPKQLDAIMAKVLGYQAPPCLAVFKDRTTEQVSVVEVPL